ncbi:MAG TPA: pitrilysin family protein [Gemmatimonadales bacterium]|nr:pitrilysin family protein [Gemmatimonadales bacterium]
MKPLLWTVLPVLLAAPAAAQKQTPPPVGTPKDFKLPAKRELTLSNGMAVTLVPFGRVPKAAVVLVVRTGRINERADQVWLSELTGDLMQEGTKTLSAARLAEEMAGMGGGLTVAVKYDLTTIGGEVLGERAPDMIRLVADVTRNPLLPASELARLKADRLRLLSIQKSQPQPIAEERFREILYGSHPYGRLFPSEQTLQGFTADQVRSFHRANYGARRAHLYVAGVFDARSVETAIRSAFGDWKAGPAPQEVRPRTQAKRTLALLDRPNAVQSTIVLGIPVPDPVHPDYMALQVTNSLLGGAFGSRITSNIREEKGYSYSPGSAVTDLYRQAHWAEQADVTTNVTGASLKEIFKEIDRLRAEAPPEPELTGIKKNAAGIFTLQNSSRMGIIGRLQFVDLHGLPDSYLTDYVKRVLAVTPEQVKAVAQKYLRPDQMTIVVVGDKKTVAGQIKEYGNVSP